eukprot:1035158-Pleurochrysis_carterae.AAC.1
MEGNVLCAEARGRDGCVWSRPFTSPPASVFLLDRRRGTHQQLQFAPLSADDTAGSTGHGLSRDGTAPNGALFALVPSPLLSHGPLTTSIATTDGSTSPSGHTDSKDALAVVQADGSVLHGVHGAGASTNYGTYRHLPLLPLLPMLTRAMPRLRLESAIRHAQHGAALPHAAPPASNSQLVPRGEARLDGDEGEIEDDEAWRLDQHALSIPRAEPLLAEASIRELLHAMKLRVVACLLSNKLHAVVVLAAMVAGFYMLTLRRRRRAAAAEAEAAAAA